MNEIKRTKAERLVQFTRYSLIMSLWSVCLVSADEFDDLARVTQAEGEQYIHIRNALLKTHPKAWNIAASSSQSWEMGLAAYILNQRLKVPDAFVFLDNQHPRSYVHVHGYGRLSNSPGANTAFLLEKMWKAPGEQKERRWAVAPDQDREFAYNTLKRNRSLSRSGDTTMWIAIWDQSGDDRLEYVAVTPICAAPDSSTQRIILDVLQDEGKENAARLRSRCFVGLQYRDTEETVDALLDSKAIFEKERGPDDVIAVFSHNSSPRARTFIHEFILNPANNETHRGEAVSKLCNLPHPSDEEIIRRFLASPVSVRVKRNALLSIGSHCPIDHILPAIREVLISSDDPKVIAYAASALNGAYGRAKKVDEAAKAEDAALLESVLEKRDDLSSATRVHMDMYIRGMRAKPGDPRVTLPDRPSDK